ncbi:alpha/beta fold hydrolase [Microtetraspora glauca]|uniref:Alpha/beta fold hydrolase n=1 Tax=Microtetraspora glauca TaxID=1996 RepID=A0ABV3G623_MICGL
MADYVDVNGVSMWYDDRGEGDFVVLLHGGLTDSRDFSGNLDALAGRFRLLLPERRGHGRTADVPGPITIEVMAQDIIAFLDKIVAAAVRLVGYSAGAAVALRVAVSRPDLVDRLVLVSGGFHPDGMILRPTADDQPPAPLVAAYAEVSPDGADHFPVVLAKIAHSAAEEPGMAPADLRAVTCPALVMTADDDIVTLEHTLELYRALPNAELAVVPRTSHLLLHEKPELCTGLVTDFLSSEPAPTWMPVSRAGSYTAFGPFSHEQGNLPPDLAKPARRALVAAGFTHLGQLTLVSEADLGRLHGMGPKAMDQLRRALTANGLSFAEER